MTGVVARLRRLEAAATPGPWVYVKNTGTVKRGTRWVTHLPEPGGDVNGDLIVAARNALPQLLAIAEAARRLSRHAANPLNCDCPRIGSLIEHVHEIEAALAALDSQETE